MPRPATDGRSEGLRALARLIAAAVEQDRMDLHEDVPDAEPRRVKRQPPRPMRDGLPLVGVQRPPRTTTPTIP